MVSPNLSEIVTTTLRNRSGVVADDVTKNNGLLTRLNSRGRKKPVSGGRTIVQELQYQENSTFKRYSGYEILNVQPSDVITAAEYDYKQAAVAVSMSGLEQLQNSGEDAVLDLLEQRIENAETTLKNNIALDCYSDGTADGGKQIGGLQLLISTSPTSGTVGGINRATWGFWRNAKFSASADGGAAASTTNIQSYMNRLYMSCVRGPDAPDLIIGDNNYFRLYWESLQAIQRITSADKGMAGFQSLQYMGADVIFDGGFGGGAPLNQMFFLNTKYLFYRPHRDRDMAPIGDERMNTNQDAFVQLMGFAGNLTMNNAFLQGVLFA
ncbi:MULTISPECIES: phage major capsid protein [Rhizobium]|uniref:phage major capsid protein n=1 Tax=Rhizobium TaxID=379 RepID=UPI001B333FFE|nr:MULTISPECIES: phage major capsid protein [Rhizobium]MBX4911242.1 phage major capsid protein [Rhizobium bangladeshense]MBX5260359.1 phage major capsid protein [Rhizobium sp. NLR16b]MBX5266449.1 phage major capsid protein [Rhizobium sp. NLR16a]MBX5276116.1 phage major capsid protein [Rhizobium sp. NLR13a]MBX5315017.1 phage major capsid protein [Rhizobium sp. NLR11b]